MTLELDSANFDCADPMRVGSFWTVMQDPEGNEFCVLRGPRDGWSPQES